MLRSLFLAGLARMPVIALILEFLVLSCTRVRAQEWQPAIAEHGQLTISAGLPIAVVSGTPAEIGAAEGVLFRDRVKPLLSLMGMQPRLLLARGSQRFTTTVAAISADDRIRLTAVGAATGVAPATLIEANALVDAQCSAVVALPSTSQPLRVARNMDFFPAKALGPGSVLEIVRLTGKRPYAAITWPGSAAVISGMNDAGLVACILLNHSGPDLPGGEPVGLRLASILQHDADVTSAVARFAASPVASSHYVLLADATTATLVWCETDGLHRDDPVNGWLTATNGVRREHQPHDARGFCLRDCIASATHPDDAWMRQVLSASYMSAINAQAMVFTPATRSLDLAVGTGPHPAALAPWWHVSLAEVFADGDVTRLHVDQLPASTPLRHYTAGDE